MDKGMDAAQAKIRLSLIITRIDDLLNRQLNEVLHHPEFKRMEASWRGLLYLTEQTAYADKEQKVRIKLLSLSWQELARDIRRAIDVDQSEFFKKIYGTEFDMAGGEPFGLVIADFVFGNHAKPGCSIHDLDVLKEMTKTAAAAFSPLICSPHPDLFGVDQYVDMRKFRSLDAHFEQAEYVRYRALRQMEESRFLGMVMPQVLMRPQYRMDGSRHSFFPFVESDSDAERDYLWGSACYAFASVMVQAFCEYGWFGQVRGMVPGQFNRGLVSGLTTSPYATDVKSQYQDPKGVQVQQPVVNLQVGDNMESALSENGFIPLNYLANTGNCAFFSNPSVHQPKRYEADSVNVNARLSVMLQYILCVSRFAHYIKMMGRDKIGSYFSAADCQRELQTWLQGYTTASDNASEEVRGRYPLHEARIEVKEQRGKPGHYYSIIRLQPHFQLDQMVTSIKLVTELTSGSTQ